MFSYLTTLAATILTDTAASFEWVWTTVSVAVFTVVDSF